MSESQTTNGQVIDIDREAWVFCKRKDITVNGDLYLRRWVLLRTPLIQVMVHKFFRGDDDRCLHNHPWVFWTFIFNNGYHEVTPKGTFFRKPLRLYYRPLNWSHRVVLDKAPTWTLVVTGPKKRTWGFFTTKGFVKWRNFLENRDGHRCE